MNKAERAAMLRQKYFTTHPKQAAAPVAKEHRERRPDRVNHGINWRARYGMQLVFRLKQWIAEPDAIVPNLTPQTRRTARKSALTRIAEQYPKRLPRS